MDEFPFSALFLFAQSCLTDAVNVIFSDYCFTDTYLTGGGRFCKIRTQWINPFDHRPGGEGKCLDGIRRRTRAGCTQAWASTRRR